MTLLIFYVLLAIGFSFYCSVAEAVLLSASEGFIASEEKRGTRTGRQFRWLKAHIDQSLAAILTLNTVAHTAGAAGAGAQAAIVFGDGAVGVASAVLTLLILIFSEIIPKTLGAVYWKGLSPVIAPSVRYLVLILLPFVKMSEIITRMISRGEERISAEEISALAELGQKQGTLDPEETRILNNLLLYREIAVREIMTPRTVVFSLPETTTVDEFLAKHLKTPFTRVPLRGEKSDAYTGFAIKSDILMEARDNEEIALGKLKRPLRAVPDNAKLMETFDFMLSTNQHILQIVDEFGTLRGILTLEDAVETLLGLEIVDERDKITDMRKLARKIAARRIERETGQESKYEEPE